MIPSSDSQICRFKKIIGPIAAENEQVAKELLEKEIDRIENIHIFKADTSKNKAIYFTDYPEASTNTGFDPTSIYSDEDKIRLGIE